MVELKRGTADRDVHLQAITYAALVSRFDIDTLTQAHRDFLSRRGQTLDIDACRQRLLDHVDGECSPALLQRPRQVIIAADFPKQVTHSVVWLSEMGIDIDLVQVGLWRVEGHIVAGFTKVYPTPEVEEFTLTPTRVEGEAAAKKLQERSRSRNAVHVLVGAGLLPDGTRLLMTPRHGVTEAIRAEIRAWVAQDTGRAAATWTNDTAKPLVWDADGASYSPTGLANHIFTSVTGRTADGIQGTTWWDVDTAHVPADVDPDAWATLAGSDLTGLARQLSGTRKDWTGLHTLLSGVPAGRWTTYGDLAAAVGSHAVPIGQHLGTCGRCPNPLARPHGRRKGQPRLPVARPLAYGHRRIPPDQGRRALRWGHRRPGPAPAPGRAPTPPRRLRALRSPQPIVTGPWLRRQRRRSARGRTPGPPP